MTRFEPDTLGQALVRFFDMAAPDGNVYLEIPAPDIRFAAIVLLSCAAGLFWSRLGPGRRPTFAFLGLLLLSAAIWLATSGNGRYFMAMLVCVGPLAIALVCLLPTTRSFKAMLAALLVFGQGFMLFQQPPWNAWTLAHWKDGPYFGIELGPEERHPGPVTYGAISILSYSLIAPQFPSQARWTSFYATPVTRNDERREEAFLQRAFADGPVKVLAPAIPEATLPDGTPNEAMVKAMDRLVARRNVRISGRCHFIAAPGFVQMAQRNREVAAKDAPKLGFWSCPLAYQPVDRHAPSHDAAPATVEQVFARLGDLCPVYFAPGQKTTFRVADGWVRHFTSDTRVYVLDNGQVWYKYWRSFNPVKVGSVDAIVSGEATLNCLEVRGSDRAWHSGRQ